MKDNQASSEFVQVLDYILNRCTIREIDALEAAVERRRRDLSARTGVISLDPARAAHQMTEAVQKSIDQSMEGIRGTLRTFAADTLHKDAPELTQEQMEALIDEWIPKQQPKSEDNPASEKYTGLSRKGCINGLPSEAMRMMVYQFVAYSTGAMPLADEASLRNEIGDWTTMYWDKFPDEIRNLIKDLLSGFVSETEFSKYLSQLLQ